MITRRIYRLLEHPLCYSISQALLGPGAGRLLPALLNETFTGPAGPILDVGCGPKLTTPTPDGPVFGVDINRAYVKQFQSGRTAGQFRGIVSRAEALPFGNNVFVECRSFGLLHHLDDEIAEGAVSEMYRVAREKGRVVILDNVWPHSAAGKPIAFLTRRFDRGQWVRTEEHLTALVSRACPGPWTVSRHTYSFTGLELLRLVLDRDSR